MSEADRRGFVSLVGAGPGDPDLITVAGRDCLRHADVILYDRLTHPRLLDEAPACAEQIDVGKTPSDHPLSQEAIADLLVERARAGAFVVRLKGGDPFVFGRGGEEAQRLIRAGIDFEVVPGVTSAVAAPAYAGIPLTHRDYASSFSVVTGHEDDAKTASAHDWSAIARGADTLVFLMGLRSLPRIAQRLIANGRDPATPAAAVCWGTTSRQRVVEATLATIADEVDRAGLQPPVVTVVGEVVRLRRELRWFESRPLFAKRVLVTRTRRQASTMVRLLLREGAKPLEFPSIALEPCDPAPVRAALRRLADGHYHWVLFTSVNGVDELFQHLRALDLDARAFAGVRLAALGPETARALARCGLTADLVPERFVTDALLEAMARQPLRDVPILLARAEAARSLLPDGLRERGALVDEVPLYVARRPATPDAALIRHLDAGEVDIATFTASSTVRGCLDLLDGRVDRLARTFVACIGPVTAATARELGLHVDLVSEVHTIPGLIAALRGRFESSPSDA